jgi:hypothetical protein
VKDRACAARVQWSHEAPITSTEPKGVMKDKLVRVRAWAVATESGVHAAAPHDGMGLENHGRLA